MGDDEQYRGVGPFLNTEMILAASLIAGVLVFLLVTLFLRSNPGPVFNPKASLSSPMVLVGVLTALAAIGAAAVVPGQIAANQRGTIRSTPDRERHALALLKSHQAILIVTLAILEGAAFFNLIGFLLEGSPMNLGLAGVMVLLMAMQFPTASRLEAWLEDQERKLLEH